MQNSLLSLENLDKNTSNLDEKFTNNKTIKVILNRLDDNITKLVSPKNFLFINDNDLETVIKNSIEIDIELYISNNFKDDKLLFKIFNSILILSGEKANDFYFLDDGFTNNFSLDNYKASVKHLLKGNPLSAINELEKINYLDIEMISRHCFYWTTFFQGYENNSLRQVPYLSEPIYNLISCKGGNANKFDYLNYINSLYELTSKFNTDVNNLKNILYKNAIVLNKVNSFKAYKC